MWVQIPYEYEGNRMRACRALIWIRTWNITFVYACVPFGKVLLTHFAPEWNTGVYEGIIIIIYLFLKYYLRTRLYSIREGACDTFCTRMEYRRVRRYCYFIFWNNTFVHACIPFGEVFLTHFARNLVQIHHDHLLHALPPTHNTQNINNYQIKEPYLSAKEPKHLQKSPNVCTRAQTSAKEPKYLQKSFKHLQNSLNPPSPPSARSAACKALLW